MPFFFPKLLHFCVVGSGPAGFYTLSTLLKRFPTCRVDILESLPTPFGLLRYGVAPDHPEARAVATSFSKLMEENKRARYFGNVKVGERTGININCLQNVYSGVVLATGCPTERKLNIPGEGLRGVCGAGEFVKWYNGHPEMEETSFDLRHVEDVVVVGNGNVALDVGRILLRNPDSLRHSDMPLQVLEELRRSSVRKVTVVGRRGPAQAAWTAKELRECLSGLEGSFNTNILKEDLELDQEDVIELKNRRSQRRCVDLLKKYVKNQRMTSAQNRLNLKQLELRFLLSPQQFHSTDGKILSSALFSKNILTGTAGDRVAKSIEPPVNVGIPTQLTMRSIGFQGMPFSDVPSDNRKGIYLNQRGRIWNGLYCTGWCKRGPQGIVGSNLWDAEETVESIEKDVQQKLLQEVDSPSDMSFLGQFVDWNGWLRIDEEEKRRGAMLKKEREKMTDIGTMLELSNSGWPRGLVTQKF